MVVVYVVNGGIMDCVVVADVVAAATTTYCGGVFTRH